MVQRLRRPRRKRSPPNRSQFQNRLQRATCSNWEKPFLETAPYLIVVFKKNYDLEGEKRKKNYYVNESVGIASGVLLTALHQSGLVTLTHTPSPMGFLEKILNRPKNERAVLLIPVGLPSVDAMVPKLEKKGFEQICSIV